MHKIAFSGIPGSGKTTILAEVKKILSFKFRVEDVPDQRLSSPFDFDRKTDFISQFFFISNQINQENIHSLNHPDFLFCDCSILDHWLEWQRCLAKKISNGQIEKKHRLLKNIYQFWLPSYTVTFRIRVDMKVLKKRITQSGLREYPLGHNQQMDDLYSQISQTEPISTFEIWNHQSIDESAQEVIKHISDLKLI